jgi:protein LTV1
MLLPPLNIANVPSLPTYAQAELPVFWKLTDLTPDQLAILDDELVARIKAREAYERQYAAECLQEPGDDDRAVEAEFASVLPEQWDCESVLSLRSNLSNHPGQIRDEMRICAGTGCGGGSRVQLSAKTGLPLGVVGITLASVQEGGGESPSEADEKEAVNLGAARALSESLEDKRVRKAAVKEAKRVARQAKKELKGVYAQERKRAQKHAATNKGAQVSVVCIA